MKTEPTIYTEQIDDAPLLYGLLQKMGLQPIVDNVLQPHGNRQGLSIGWITIIWLIHILREKNHCMDVVQGWAVKMQGTLKKITGQSIVELDFTVSSQYFGETDNLWRRRGMRRMKSGRLLPNHVR